MSAVFIGLKNSSPREREREREKYFGLAVLSMVLAIFTYQSTIALFVILSIPFAMKTAENFKKYVLNGFAIGIVYAIPVLLDLAAFKFIFKSTRFVENADHVTRLKWLFWNLYPRAVNSLNILPRYMFLLITLVIFAAAVVWALTCRHSLWRIFNTCVIVGAGCLFSTAAIIQGSSGWAARTVYPFASIPAALAIDLFVNKEDAPVNEFIKNAARYISLAALAIMMTGQYLYFNKIYTDKYRVNALDQYLSLIHI